MGLFQGKQQSKKHSPADEVSEGVHEIFDKQYREELRANGREYFERATRESAVRFKEDLDVTVANIGAELKEYMTKQLDETIARIDGDLTKRLDQRLAEYDIVTRDAQNQAVQSLNRNAHALHDKYQQLASTLQQAVASQEAMMISVFEENKTRMIKTQDAQEAVLEELQQSADTSRQQSQQLGATLEKTAADQAALLAKILKDNEAQVAAAKKAQDVVLQTLSTGAQALDQQYQQLSATLQQSVMDQKALLVGAFESNMAQVIEHYLLGALGDQYDMKAQLPLIIKQMEANKQDIMDDMKL